MEAPPPYAANPEESNKIKYGFLWADDRAGPFYEFFDPEETIREVKERVCQRLPGAQWTDLNISRPGDREPLNSKSPLSTCDIRPFDRLIITVAQSFVDASATPAIQQPASNDFPVFVKTMANRTLTIWVNTDSKVEHLKREVMRMEGIAMDEQRLICGGKQLDNLNWLLRDYDVGKQANIFMVGRLRGGRA